MLLQLIQVLYVYLSARLQLVLFKKMVIFSSTTEKPIYADVCNYSLKLIQYLQKVSVKYSTLDTGHKFYVAPSCLLSLNRENKPRNIRNSIWGCISLFSFSFIQRVRVFYGTIVRDCQPAIISLLPTKKIPSRTAC